MHRSRHRGGNLVLAALLLALSSLSVQSEGLPLSSAQGYGSAISLSAVVQPQATWRPSFMGLHAYFGELHQHTGYSPDGCGLPLDAVRTARGRGNDFFAFTEHHNSFYRPEIGSEEKGCRLSVIDTRKWEMLLDLTHRTSDEGSFIVLRGYEYTREPGHLNVFNTATYDAPLSLDELYSWLAGQPETVFAQFNHPMPFDLGGMGDFEGFRFFPPAAHRIPLIENAWAQQFYLIHPRALSVGWELSSVGYGDSHDAAQAGSRRYGVMAPAMTRADLIAALAQGRTFGNTDGYLVAALRGNGRWMGQALSDDQIELEMYAADASGDTIMHVELVGQNGVLRTWQPRTQVFSETMSISNVKPGDFFYLHVTDERGGHGWSGLIIRPLRRTLQLTPATLQFGFTDGASLPQERTIRIEANDGTDAPWRTSTTEPWIHIEPDHGDHLPATITIQVSPSDLALGMQTGGLILESPPLAPAAAGVLARIGLHSPYALSVEPREVDVTTSVGASASGGTLRISSSGEGLAWCATSNEPWLRLGLSRGIGSGALSFSADMEGYPAGLYKGHITVMLGQEIRVCEVRVALQPRNAHHLILQQGISGEAAWQDTFLNMWEPDQPHGTQPRLVMRNATSDGASVPLLRVDLTDIPRDVQVFTATLSVNAYNKTVPGSSVYVQAFEVLKPWEAHSATWTTPGTGWAGRGVGAKCENVACQPSGVAIVNAIRRWYDLDITTLAQRWVRDPSSNQGLALVGEYSTNGLFMYHSTEAGSVSTLLRPRLSLVYGEAAPTPSPTPSATVTAMPSATATAAAWRHWLPLMRRR